MPARKPPARPTLPPVTVARFEEAAKLIERLVEEKQDVFLAAAHRYRERHRDVTSRGLDFREAAQVAAAMFTDPRVDQAVMVQQSDLRAYDEPAAQEILVAAGVATSPAFLDACKRVVALIELPADEFKAAREDDALDDALASYMAGHLDDLEMPAARARARAAFDAFSRAAGGGSSGEAWALLSRMVGQAFTQAMSTVGAELHGSGLSSLMGSPPSTDGGDGMSSMTPGGVTP